MASPTARTLAHLRRLGYLAAVVERWLPRIERKADLFGIADVLAVHPRDKAVLLVQATTLGHVADRLKRIKARPELALLLKAGLAVEVWGWRGRELRRVALRPENLQAVLVQDVRSRRRQKGERQGLLWDATSRPPRRNAARGKGCDPRGILAEAGNRELPRSEQQLERPHKPG